MSQPEAGEDKLFLSIRVFHDSIVFSVYGALDLIAMEDFGFRFPFSFPSFLVAEIRIFVLLTFSLVSLLTEELKQGKNFRIVSILKGYSQGFTSRERNIHDARHNLNFALVAIFLARTDLFSPPRMNK